METPRNTFFSVITAASLLILVTAAPLHQRQTRQVHGYGNDLLLDQVQTELLHLFNNSVYDLMNKFNISGSYENATEVTGVLFPALDVTCELYRANSTLIPTIANLTHSASPSTMVLSKLGMAGVNNSCKWLRNEVIGNGGAMDCSNLSEICKSRRSIKEYEEAKSIIHIYTTAS